MNGRIASDHTIPWLTTYVWLLIVSWTVVISASVTWNLLNQNESMREIALSEARAYFKKDQAFRLWATSHGGVYVPSDERTPPSPYLAHVPGRDIETPSGVLLTLMNPSYALRQLNEEFTELYGVAGHITSLKPLRPQNAPDDWERAALIAFDDGEKEVTDFAEVGGEPHLRLMGLLPTEEDCLRCHANQGYQVGDVIGGVGVSVPMTHLLAVKREQAAVVVLGHGGLWFLGLLGIGLGARQISQRIRERDQAREARARFERLLSPVLAEKVVSGDLQVRLGGELYDASILFIDIREFTPMSEGAAPAAIVELLNEYFEVMVEVVFENDGTLDKFVGDEVMAVYGAPMPQPDHAPRAVRTALGMRTALAKLNESRSQRGLPTIRAGIGISSGTVVAGYMGSSKVMDYTAIGDTVNTAARLCSVAKSGEILISRATREQLDSTFEVEAREPIELKGKSQPLDIFNVTSHRTA